MLCFQMVIQTFAMIADDDNQRVRVELAVLKKRRQAFELPYFPGNARVIRTMHKLWSEEIGTRIIRRVRVEQVNPAKERARRSLPQPRQGRVDDRLPVATGFANMVPQRFLGKVIV